MNQQTCPEDTTITVYIPPINNTNNNEAQAVYVLLNLRSHVPAVNRRSAEVSNVTVLSNKCEYAVKNIPKMHKLVSKYHLSRLKTKSKRLDIIVKRIESNHYQDTTICCCLMVAAILSVPQGSQLALHTCTSLMYVVLCSNYDIPINMEKVAKITPSTSMLKNILANTVTDSILYTMKGIKANNHAYVISDKVNSGGGGQS